MLRRGRRLRLRMRGTWRGCELVLGVDVDEGRSAFVQGCLGLRSKGGVGMMVAFDSERILVGELIMVPCVVV